MVPLSVARWSLFVPGFGFGPLSSSPGEARQSVEAAMMRAYRDADPAERGSIESFLGRAVDLDKAVLVQLLAGDSSQLVEVEQELDLAPRGAR